MNVAIFLPNWVGDLVMATPTLRAVRRYLGPAARIVGIVRPQLAELLSGTPWIDKLHGFDPRSPAQEHGRLALLMRLRRKQFDMALAADEFVAHGRDGLARRRKERVGYARDGRSWFLTRRVPASPARWPPLSPGGNGGELSGSGPRNRLPGRVAAIGTGRDRERARTGGAGVARSGPAERRSRGGLELDRRLRGGKGLARRTLRRAGPADRRKARSRRVGASAVPASATRPGRSLLRSGSPRVFSLAAQEVRPGAHQGLPRPLPADGIDR